MTQKKILSEFVKEEGKKTKRLMKEMRKKLMTT